MYSINTEFISDLGRKCAPILAVLILSAAAGTIAVAAEAKQKAFATPEDAAKALIAATKSGDTKALLGILGADAKAIISSGDAVADREGRARFVKSYEEANKLTRSGNAQAILSTGRDDWPFPIPIVMGAAGWRFDAKQGREEILNRRIGRNELSAMQAMLAYVDAQREYYLSNPQRDKLLHYTQRFVSTQGNVTSNTPSGNAAPVEMERVTVRFRPTAEGMTARRRLEETQ